MKSRLAPSLSFIAAAAALSCALVPGARRAAAAGATPSATQQAAVSAPASLPSAGPRAALKGSYKLGPQDVLAVFVDKHPEFSNPRLVVPPDGQIALPAAGSFHVNGRTVAQVQKEIAAHLARRLLAPQVTVTIVELRDASLGYVSVVGDVNKPGFVAIREGWRLTELIAAVGGVPGRLDETRATLARIGTPAQTVDLHGAVSFPLSRANVKVRADDVLSVILQEPKSFAINGDVNKPDVYELRKAPHLLDAIVAAGGLKQRPDATTAFILRKGQKIELHLQDAIELKNAEANVALQAGDFITVEAIPPLSVAVDGFVRNPGNFTLGSDARVLQAIAQAGGLTTTPDKIVTTVRRGVQIIKVDLQRALLTDDVSADTPLRNGDVLMLTEPEVMRVQVTGAVAHPGPYRLPIDAHVLDALAQAGGLTVPPRSAHLAVLREQENGAQTVLHIDAAALTDLRDISQNAVLKDGDLVNVAEEAAQNAFISGEVARPGSYPIQPGDGVPELIAQAGGPTDQALLSHVTVQRGAKSFRVDVFATMRTGGPKPDFKLQSGDFVVVEQNKQKVLVMQAVEKPGYYTIPENGTLSLSEVLALAGGVQAGAKTKEVAVMRRDSHGEVERQVVKLDEIGKGKLENNLALRGGDIVFVPDASKGNQSSLATAFKGASFLRLFGLF